MQDIVKKSAGDSDKEVKLASTMAKLITDGGKAYRRYLAAKEVKGEHWEPTRIFLRRAAQLQGYREY